MAEPRACPTCGRPIVQHGRWGLAPRRYCSARCRKEAQNARQRAARQPAPPDMAAG